jgi:hypothetical protein
VYGWTYPGGWTKLLVLTDRDVATSIDQLLTLLTDGETDRHKDRRKSCIYHQFGLQLSELGTAY